MFALPRDLIFQISFWLLPWAGLEHHHLGVGADEEVWVLLVGAVEVSVCMCTWETVLLVSNCLT